MNIYRFLLAAMILLGLAPAVQAKKGRNAAGKEPATVLIIWPKDNIRSNYYVTEMVAEDLGISADSLQQQFNCVIAENIADNESCRFIAGRDTSCRQVAQKIGVQGEGESSTSDLSGISPQEWQTLLNNTHADYLLVLNQHYLKWQEEPMLTVFHIVSYSLYDRDKKQLYSGNQFFTSMKPESKEKMKQISRKSTARIATSVSRALDI